VRTLAAINESVSTAVGLVQSMLDHPRTAAIDQSQRWRSTSDDTGLRRPRHWNTRASCDLRHPAGRSLAMSEPLPLGSTVNSCSRDTGQTAAGPDRSQLATTQRTTYITSHSTVRHKHTIQHYSLTHRPINK